MHQLDRLIKYRIRCPPHLHYRKKHAGPKPTEAQPSRSDQELIITLRHEGSITDREKERDWIISDGEDRSSRPKFLLKRKFEKDSFLVQIESIL